jgi:hypothetical protein
VAFNVNWAAQDVPFPRFSVQLREDQSADDFMDEVEKKVNAMIDESTMNEYKAFKNLVKHKKRINRVFSEVCGDRSSRSRRPGIKMKAPAAAVASCLAAPSKISRRTSSKKRRECGDGTPPSSVCPKKTKSLESSKRKHQSSEAVSDVELQAATSPAGLSRKKMKKAVKKIATAEVRRVPSAFDDIVAEPSRKGFFFCPWPDLRFNVHRHCTPGSENDFVDVETFSDDIADVQKGAIAPVVVVVADKVADPRPSGSQDQASPEFVKELEMIVHRGGSPVQNAAFVETHEDIPKDQDPSPSMIAFNKSFGTFHRGNY